MATHKQEDIYNKIMKYYNFIDQLIDLSHEDPELKRDAEFKIVQSIHRNLRTLCRRHVQRIYQLHKATSIRTNKD